MYIPNMAQLLSLIESGALTIDQVKKTVELLYKIVQLVDSMAQDPLVATMMGPSYQDLANAPVTEETLAGVTPQGHWLDPKETTARVKAMTEAIAKEQWVDGFIVGMQVMAMIAGV